MTKAWHGGKGSAPRKGADHKSYSSNWDSIFKKKDGMWEHDCKVSGKLSILQGEECSWCGAIEESPFDEENTLGSVHEKGFATRQQ